MKGLGVKGLGLRFWVLGLGCRELRGVGLSAFWAFRQGLTGLPRQSKGGYFASLSPM